MVSDGWSSCCPLHETSRKRLIWVLTSGFIVFIGGISWEGFGGFLSVILIVELCRFLSSETEEGLGFYLLSLGKYLLLSESKEKRNDFLKKPTIFGCIRSPQRGLYTGCTNDMDGL